MKTLFAKLAQITQRNNGLWSAETERESFRFSR